MMDIENSDLNEYEGEKYIKDIIRKNENYLKMAQNRTHGIKMYSDLKKLKKNVQAKKSGINGCLGL